QHRVVDVTVDGAQQLDIAPEVDEIATERRWRGVADLGTVDRQPLLRSFAGGPLLADALLELRHLPVPHPYLSAQLLELRLALLEEVDAPAETRQLPSEPAPKGVSHPSPRVTTRPRPPREGA